MLVKVCFKFLESFVQCFEAGAGVSRRRVLRTQDANSPDQISRSIVLLHHGMDGILYSLKEGRFNRTTCLYCALQRVYVRKEDLLFLLHVHDHLSANFHEELPDVH